MPAKFCHFFNNESVFKRRNVLCSLFDCRSMLERPPNLCHLFKKWRRTGEARQSLAIVRQCIIVDEVDHNSE